MNHFIPDISEKTLQQWQDAVDLLARTAGVRASLIMRLIGDEIEVFVSSSTQGNPYHPGDREYLYGSGLYCEAVIQAQEKLLVVDARQTEQFKHNPDLKYGLVCYLGFPIRYSDGAPFGTICLLDDKANGFTPDLITLLEKMRDLIESQLCLLEENRRHLLFASESVLRKMLDHIPTALACITPDVDGKVLYLNKQFTDLFGYTTADIPLVKDWMARAYPEAQSRTALVQAWQAAVAQEFQQAGRVEPREVSIICKDGRIREVLISFNLLDDMLLVSFVDITERKHAEMELRLSEERIRLLAENVSDVIWVLNLSQKCFTYISPSIEQLRGFSVEEAMAQTMEESLMPESVELVMQKLTKNVPLFLANPKAPQSFMSEVRQPCKDGSIIWVEVTTRFRFNEAHEIEVVGVSRNISQRKRYVQELKEAHEAVRAANAELEQRVQERTAELMASRDALSASNAALNKALRARDGFMSAMSHELRTPLMGILGPAEVLRTGIYGSLNDKQLKSIQNIESSGQRLHSLINDVLDYAQFQSGDAGLDIHDNSLDAICALSLQAIHNQAAAKSLQVEYQVAVQDLWVRVDQRRMVQALVNLLDNAVKFTPRLGRIRLATAGNAEAGQVQISVTDSGIGIQEEDFEKIFQPFVQLDARLEREYQGTGLGLALVKTLVELHQGSLAVESEPGKGSTFTVSLPWKGP